MLYFDYSATTPVEDEVINVYNKVVKDYWANPNSIHSLGLQSHKLMDEAKKQVIELLGLKDKEVVFTSSASEANNLAIKGAVHNYKNRSKHVITTLLEHSSVSETMHFLEKDGFIVHYVKIDSDGMIDIDDLDFLLEKYQPIIFSMCLVNSEVGILQDIERVKKVLKKYPLCFLHVDATQAIGKIPVSLDDIDLCTFSAHKMYGLKGVACLIKNKKIKLTPLIHGGKSQTIYRASTPDVAHMVSMVKTLKLALKDLDKKYDSVTKLQQKLLLNLKKCKDITINSNSNCIPHIINFSLYKIKSETFLHALEQKEIYISTKTACSSDKEESATLKAMGKDKDLTTRSLRISLSHKTTLEDIDIFTKAFNECLDELNFMKGE